MLNLLNNLIKVTGKQGGTIHDYLDLNKKTNLDYFYKMNSIIVMSGYLTRDQLIHYAFITNAEINL